MSDKNLPLKVSAIASSAVFNLAFGIAGLIVHLQNNMPDPLCGLSNYYLSLSKWLEGATACIVDSCADTFEKTQASESRTSSSSEAGWDAPSCWTPSPRVSCCPRESFPFASDRANAVFQVWGLIVGMFSFAWMIVGE
jgi:hypothetical protein